MTQIWAEMSTAWTPQHDRTPDSIEKHCHTVWENMRRETSLTENLVDSMQQRISNLYDNALNYSLIRSDSESDYLMDE